MSKIASGKHKQLRHSRTIRRTRDVRIPAPLSTAFFSPPPLSLPVCLSLFLSPSRSTFPFLRCCSCKASGADVHERKGAPSP